MHFLCSSILCCNYWYPLFVYLVLLDQDANKTMQPLSACMLSSVEFIGINIKWWPGDLWQGIEEASGDTACESGTGTELEEEGSAGKIGPVCETEDGRWQAAVEEDTGEEEQPQPRMEWGVQDHRLRSRDPGSRGQRLWLGAGIYVFSRTEPLLFL